MKSELTIPAFAAGTSEGQDELTANLSKEINGKYARNPHRHTHRALILACIIKAAKKLYETECEAAYRELYAEGDLSSYIRQQEDGTPEDATNFGSHFMVDNIEVYVNQKSTKITHEVLATNCDYSEAWLSTEESVMATRALERAKEHDKMAQADRLEAQALVDAYLTRNSLPTTLYNPSNTVAVLALPKKKKA